MARLGGILQVVLALWSRLEAVWNGEAPILDPWVPGRGGPVFGRPYEEV